MVKSFVPQQSGLRKSVGTLVPEITENDTRAAPAGCARKRSFPAGFWSTTSDRGKSALVACLQCPIPAATASLAIAEESSRGLPHFSKTRPLHVLCARHPHGRAFRLDLADIRQ